jgi:hypothetical protein
VARTSLQVTVRIPSTRPGSRAEFIETANIPIDVPLDLTNAGAALRSDNRIVLEGRLERDRQRIAPERSEPVSAALEALRDRHAREVAQRAGTPRAAQRGLAACPRQLCRDDQRHDTR